MIRINRDKVISMIGETGMTQMEFLRENKIVYNSFSRAVLNGKNCSIKTAGKIARAIGLKVADILVDEGKEA